MHGESDHLAGNNNYEANLLEWQANYELDVVAATQQAEGVPLLQTQMSSWTKLGQAESVIPQAQLAASRNHPDRIVLVGPKYMLPYAADGVHLTNEGYRWMGQYYAKAYRRVVLEGQPWRPLQPSMITRVGAMISVTFDVPEPPLVLDAIGVSNPGNFGFEFVDESGAPPPIVEVTLASATTLTVLLQSEPTGAGKRLRYAYTGQAGASAGPTTGPRGNVRDSDSTSSALGYSLFNWCVHFDEPVL